VKSLIILSALFSISSFGYAQNLELETHWWQPNGTVDAFYKDTVANILYIGGGFSRIDKDVDEPNGAVVDSATGVPDWEFANPNGQVNAAVGDGTGGWFIGGSFTMVGDSIRNGLAHLDSTGLVTRWNPNIPGIVYCLLTYETMLYVGGQFNAARRNNRQTNSLDPCACR